MSDWILGIDGGGTSTIAWIAESDAPDDIRGRGFAGPSNPQAVGIESALGSLEAAIESACWDAGIECDRFAAACIALAGIDREGDRARIDAWAERRRLAERLIVVNDALPVLYAASDDGAGIALISGTGSFAFGRNSDGTTARAGGWGYRFGDEGSAYGIAIAGLRAAAKAHDGRGTPTGLLELLLNELGLADPQQLITAVYAPEMTRAGIAALSQVVFRAQDAGDAAATAIVDSAVLSLAELVVAVSRQLDLSPSTIPLAVTRAGQFFKLRKDGVAGAGRSEAEEAPAVARVAAHRGFTPDGRSSPGHPIQSLLLTGPLAVTGGVLLNRDDIRRRLVDAIAERGIAIAPPVPVPNPVAGALRIALTSLKPS